MSNVKPGDLAQVIADPQHQKVCGLMLSIIGPSPNTLHVDRYGCCWLAVCLESRTIREVASALALKSPLRAGQEISVNDSILKKIEPPADSEWLWSDRPLEHDRKVSNAI